MPTTDPAAPEAPAPGGTDTDPTAGKADGSTAKKTGGAKKAAPRKRQTGKGSPRGGRPTKSQERAEKVAMLYVTASVGCDMLGKMSGNGALVADGEAFITVAEACGQAWADLAESNAQVAKVLDSLTEGNAVGAVMFAHVPLVQAIATNHLAQRAERQAAALHAQAEAEAAAQAAGPDMTAGAPWAAASTDPTTPGDVSADSEPF